MKSLYESILDDEDVLIGSANDMSVGSYIYDKLLECKKLTKDELKWMNEKVSVFKVDRTQLSNLIDQLIINDISLNWLDVSNIEDMSYIFHGSQFNGDISKWDVSKVKDMSSMFYNSKFNGDISKWDVSNVKNMYGMFEQSKFNNDISKWVINKRCDTLFMFYGSPIENKYKPKTLQKQ